jgi:hypothetical protein
MRNQEKLEFEGKSGLVYRKFGSSLTSGAEEQHAGGFRIAGSLFLERKYNLIRLIPGRAFTPFLATETLPGLPALPPGIIGHGSRTQESERRMHAYAKTYRTLCHGYCTVRHNAGSEFAARRSEGNLH